MTSLATDKFVVQLLPPGTEGRPEGPQFGRMFINESVSGGMVAATVGQMHACVQIHAAVDKVMMLVRPKRLKPPAPALSRRHNHLVSR